MALFRGAPVSTVTSSYPDSVGDAMRGLIENRIVQHTGTRTMPLQDFTSLAQ